MASKDEYYQRVIASLQSEINSLKTAVAEQGKMIAELKESIIPQKETPKEKPTRDDITAFCARIAKVCNETIQKDLDKLPNWYVQLDDFEAYCKAADKKFLHADAFTDYQKSQDKRLTSIEKRLGQGFCLLAINHYNEKRDGGHSSIFGLLKNLKDIEFEGFIPLLVSLGVALFAVFLISSIKW